MPVKGDFRDKVIGGGLGVAGTVLPNGEIYDGTKWVDSTPTQRMAATGTSSGVPWALPGAGTPSPKVWFPVKYNGLTGAKASEALVADAKAAGVSLGMFLRNLPSFQTARQPV